MLDLLLTGVELQYNEHLSGVPGVRISEIERNEENLSYTISNFTEPIDGKDVTLTIDSKIQAIAEKVAEKGLVDNQAKRVSIMVMNPNNGEILAMVNKPDFDPNNPFDGFEDFSGETDGEKLQKMWRNSLVNDTFEPGSIFKVVTMVTALEEGIASESDTFECGGSLQVGSHTIKCWKTSGHGSQILPQILQNSCNVGFMKLGEKIGKETLNEYIKKLGFGKTTGIDLPGEASGIVKKTENITESDLATISFGQTNTVTAIQYMQAFNALANGGSLIQPHIMKEVSHYNSDDTKVIDETYEPVISKNVLSDKSTATLRDYLERTVNEGGSNKSYIEGYHIGGKTGTAQKVNSVTGGYESGKYISSMAAMAPVDSPEITAFVSIDEPSNGAYYAGVVTAPLMKILLTDIFNYMDSEFSEDYNAVVRDVLIPEIRGKSIEEAKKILKDVNLEYNIEGSGEIVTNTQPYPGYTVKEGTKITIYTGDAVDNNKVSMPDLTGLSVTSAKDILDDLGIKYSLEGDGFVIDQSIPAGEVITTGSNVRLTLSDDYGD